MRPDPRAAAVLLLAVATVAGCASMSRKFTFMRPDLSKREFTRTAPEYDIKPDDPKRASRVGAYERLVLAEQRLRSGQFAEAETQARAALKQDPRSADAYTVLALSSEAQGRSAEAGGHYAKAAELAPARGAPLNNYGAWLCANGRAAESLAWFDRALADPGYGSADGARANAGACALDAGQPARAERDLRIVLQRQPSNATALAAMARGEFAAGRYLEARAFSERRLAAAPPSPEVLMLASQIEQKLGDNQAAARYRQQIAAQFPPTAQPQDTSRK